MAEQNAVATQQGTQLSVAAQVKSMISQDAVKKKFTEVLGQKAPQFLASITNVVAGSAQLKKCPATTIMSAAFVAATYDLPIDSNLGFAAIVPYNNNKYNPQTRQWEKHPEAQFQMMYKGFIQLAIRSGYYEKMNCSVVYKDELVSYNPITGEVEFVTDFSKCTQRAEGKSENIAGYYAWFKLLTGFRKELFMTTAEVENHARKYSTAYRYDLENNKKGSKWTTDFEAMALKTVIKMLLSKWGILSVDMQRATEIVSDNRNLEEMNLKKIIFHIAESFWYSDLLDGRKPLDGSSLLYPYMRYNLMLGFKYMLGGFTTPTDADLQKVKFRAEQKTENDVKAGAIRIASDIIFWNTHLLDGSWDLDGSHRLDVTRGYQLGVAIVAMVAFAHNEVTDVLKVRSAYDLRTGSEVRAAIRSEFEADFWNTVYLDGKLLLDGNTALEYRGGNKRFEASVTHHMGIKREDSDVSVQVITKTRNYWFFDGGNMLNGKKNLNSIYRKEYIQ